MGSTLSVNVKWIMEIYGFDSSDPAKQESATPFLRKPPTAILATGNAKKSINKTISKLKTSGVLLDVDTDPKVLLGINSVVLSRSKGTPDARASIGFVGPLDDSIYAGAWVVITSMTTDGEAESELIRFIGQIVGIDANYSVVDGSGLLQQTTNIVCEEWSRVLRIPVRYDEIALEQLNAGAGTQEQAIGLLSDSIKKKLTPESAEQFQNLAAAALDPFEMSSLILTIIGAISASDSVTAILDQSFPSVALTSPIIPPGLIQRIKAQGSGFSGAINQLKGLGTTISDLAGSSSTPQNPFQDGFAKTIIGQTLHGEYNNGKWNGIFTGVSIDNYADTLKNNYQKTKSKRPAAMNNVSALFSGASAWDLLNSMCDPTINEVFTDMLYEDDGNGIISRPVIVIRDKPFMPKKLQKANSNLSGWTAYDNLPRVFIPDESIVSFNIKNTILNSPNYVRVQYHGTGNDDAVPKTAATVFGLKRLDAQMQRFGGREYYIQTNYLGINYASSSPAPVFADNPLLSGAGSLLSSAIQKAGVPSSFVGVLSPGGQSGNTPENPDFYKEWFKTISDLATAWHSYDYKKGMGSITIKDDAFAVSVGFNIQFRFKAQTFVGHVESLSTQFVIDPSGLEMTYTNISLSNIMAVIPATDGYDLEFIPPHFFGQLTQKGPIQGGGDIPGTTIVLALEKINDSIGRA